MIRPKTKAGLGRIFENWAWGGGGAVQYWGAQIFFQPSLMEFFFFWKGRGPPKTLRGSAPARPQAEFAAVVENDVRTRTSLAVSLS